MKDELEEGSYISQYAAVANEGPVIASLSNTGGFHIFPEVDDVDYRIERSLEENADIWRELAKL